MVNIGIVGLGFMGYTHFTASDQLRGARVAAIATRSEKKRAGDWRGIQGNFGPPAGEVDLSDVKTYADYGDLLADPEIDLVDICLPTDQHEEAVTAALQAGKHVIVEKPIAIDLEAADRMIALAEQKQQLLMVAHVLPFFPEFQYLRDIVQSGEYGKLLGAQFRRMIAPPDWSEGMGDFRKLGGWGIDLHIHDNHYIALLCGRPRGVFSRGLLAEGFVNHVQTNYVFEEATPAVGCHSGGIAAKGHPFGHGFEAYLEEATILFNQSVIGGEPANDRPLTLITQDGNARQVTPGDDDRWCAAFTQELQAAVISVEQGQASPVLSGSLARDALQLCYAEAESIDSGQIVSL